MRISLLEPIGVAPELIEELSEPIRKAGHEFIYYPEKTNFYVDAMCIPTCAQNKELAEIFINYMLSEEPAIANAEYTYYASPNSIVYTNEGYIEDMGEDTMAVLYPELGDFSAEYNRLAYRNLDADLLSNLNTLWENIKIN